MTDLSPAAQAVLDAGLLHVVHRYSIAAALRAAANQLTHATSAHTLYAFADELEGNKDFLKNYPEVTRVEVIANCSREFVQYDCSNVQVSLQDNGQTIKLFFSTSD